jgi:acyl-coenzyme A synthetase/AMP-(fatty) acid ligase
LEWNPDGRFCVRGRRDEAVQVGGINVFPARVRKVLLEHPGVADAGVRLMTPEEGARLKAFVVAAPGVDCEALRTELERWVVNRLTVAERPKSLVFGARLPVNEQGKLADWPAVVPHFEHLNA